MSITLFGILAVAGFLIAGYVLWRQAGEERLDQKEVFDLFLGSTAWALVAARAGAIILNFDRFGWDPLRWLSIFYLPGFSGPAALAIGLFMIMAGAGRRGWEKWIALDVFSPAIMAWQAFLLVTFSWYVGLFWIVWAIFLILVSGKYRLWEWYRGKRGDARPGLVWAFWLIGTGVGILAFSSLSRVAGIILILIGIVTSYIRSSRILKSDIESFCSRFKRRRKNDFSQ